MSRPPNSADLPADGCSGLLADRPRTKVVWTAAYLCRDTSVLVRRRGHGVIDAGLYGPPGGKCEVGETLEDCLVRELREETGLVAGRRRLLNIFDSPRGVCFFYRVYEWTGTVQHIELAHGPWIWVPQQDLVTMPLQGGLAVHLEQSAANCRSVL